MLQAPRGQAAEGWRAEALRARHGGCIPSCRRPAAPPARERSLRPGEQLLDSAHLSLPADSAWLGIAQGSTHYLVIFTTLFPLLTSTFFPGFLVEIPRKKALVEPIF